MTAPMAPCSRILEHDLANARGDVASARDDLQQEAMKSSLLEQV